MMLVLALVLLFSIEAKSQNPVILQVRGKLVKMGYNPKQVDNLLDNPNLSKPIAPLRTPVRLTWDELEVKMLSGEWVFKGKSFLENHRKTFILESKAHAIAPEIITAVLTIETLQGDFLGDWPAFQIHFLRAKKLPTNAKKQAVKLAEENLALMAKFCLDIQAADCLKIPGSRSGAIGLSQFMPASLPFGEDGDGDGVVDLFKPADAIMSVGNFLASYSSAGHIASLAKQKRKEALSNPLLHALVHYLGDNAPYQGIVLRYGKTIATAE